MNTQKDRLLMLLAALNLSQSKFEDKIGASRGVISHMPDNGLTKKTISKIALKFPQVSISWLENGVGEMFGSELIPVEQCETPPAKQEAVLAEVEKQRQIIARFQKQIDRAQEQISICQEHIELLLQTFSQ